MEFRKPTADERRLLLELARIAGIPEYESWLDSLRVRNMNDGGMGSLTIATEHENDQRSGVMTSAASVQFTDEDGVEVIATLNVDERAVGWELDVWKTDFSPLVRIPRAFRSIDR